MSGLDFVAKHVKLSKLAASKRIVIGKTLIPLCDELFLLPIVTSFDKMMPMKFDENCPLN